MKLKLNEIKIESGKSFENCKLGRQKYSTILTEIINSYTDGFVLAINNKWGTGKTTFVKMWEQDLIDNKYKTIYFNAWENDSENNPLTALMGELKTLTSNNIEPKFKKALKNAAVLSKHIAPIVVKAIADKYIDTNGIKDAIVNISKGVTDVFENEVNEYANKKKSITEFKESLSEFISKKLDGKPLIFIIDELDRCRPNYAVSILEQIKHFFSIPNIVFVLSIDKLQLGNAVRGVYGSDKIDADEYLRRFIDVEYSIPEPEPGLFHKYLYEYFKYDEFFISDKRQKYRELQSDKQEFLKICDILFANTIIPLRQQEKIFVSARLSLRAFNENNFVFPTIYLFLNFIKVTQNDLYNEIKNKQLKIHQLQERFINVIGNKNINEDKKSDLIWLEGYLIHFYNNYLYTAYSRPKLYEPVDSTGNNKLLITSIVSKANNKELLYVFESMNGRRSGGDLDLGYFFNRIDLLETLNARG